MIIIDCPMRIGLAGLNFRFIDLWKSDLHTIGFASRFNYWNVFGSDPILEFPDKLERIFDCVWFFLCRDRCRCRCRCRLKRNVNWWWWHVWRWRLTIEDQCRLTQDYRCHWCNCWKLNTQENIEGSTHTKAPGTMEKCKPGCQSARIFSRDVPWKLW